MELNSEYLTERLEIRILEAHFDLAKKLLNYVKKNQESEQRLLGACCPAGD